MHQKFNPQNWLPNDNHTDIDLVVSRIEAAHTDITGSYSDWLNLGFALADELGEGGRDYFHRISRFYSKYSYTDCNRQYDQCLKSQGHGITIKTLFHLAKQGGIDVTGQWAWGMEHGARSMGQEAKSMGHGAWGMGQEANSLEPGAWGVGQEAKSLEPEAAEPQAPGSVPRAPSSEPQAIDLPTFPDSVFAALPDFLQKVVARCRTNEERDILLLGALATISSCLPNVFGIYDEATVKPNLFLFITAKASAGKGRLVYCKRLVNPVHWAFRKESHAQKLQYETEMREYNLMKMKDFTIEKPHKPAEKMLFIPANNSTTGVFQLLSDNEGKGLIFETEGDTLAQAFKTDYGNYSDGFRKAFHHEKISYYRRTDHEFVEIENPCLSTVLSGTPKQVAGLIPNAENGLFSRFIFYHMNLTPNWKRVFGARKSTSLEVYFDNLGQEFYPLYKALIENPAMEICLTEEQEEQFHVFFTQVQEKYLMLQGFDYLATIRRLGLIAFRIAMIFTSLRILETGDFSEMQMCSDADFQGALSMIRVLVKHSSHVFSELPEEVQPASKQNKKEQFLDSLPEKFTHQEFEEIAKNLSIPKRTAALYISHFCDKGLIVRDQRGAYTNLTLSGK